MYCRYCGSAVAEPAAVCLTCGCPPLAGKKHCPNCGAETGPDAILCTRCGVSFAAVMPKSRLAAGILGIFVGGLGVHRFYLGYTGLGIAQIAVTLVTFGLGALWGFIEGILILTGNFNRDAKGLPLRD